jgi:hypothetical protein
MNRNGLTLLELVVAMASSVILVAGLAGSLYISSQALPTADNPARQSAQAATIIRDMMADVGLALSFTERTDKAMTFTVPDRDGDNAPETIRYAWSGTAGDPLTYQYNSGSVIDIAASVQNFNLEGLTRLMEAEAMTAPVAANVVFESFEERKSISGASVVVTKPAGTIEGDLLIAAVSLDGEARSSLNAPSGWTLIYKGPGAHITGNAAQTFGVWWKLASSTEASSYAFTWTGSRQSYSWIMRFTGHDLNVNNTIHAFAVESVGGALGVLSPLSPAVTTTVPNAMVLRLGGFDSSRFALTDVPGLLGHTVITADGSSGSTLSSSSGAAAYTMQASPGTSGTSLFVLTGTEQYTSVTIAIAPAQTE